MKPRVLRPSRDELIAAMLSATFFGLAFPPFPLVFPAFVCLAPVAVMVARQADAGAGPRAAARVGFWFGFVGYALNLYWIAVALLLFTKLAIAGYIASLLWLSPFIAATFAALYAARRATRWPLTILLPIVWVASELVLNYLSDLSFPWLPLGLSVARYPLVAQIADLSGVRGVSFWIALTNGLVADAWLARTRRREVVRRLAAAAVTALAVAGYGAWRMRTTTLQAVAPVLVVQPNIPEDVKLRGEDKNAFVGILADVTRRGLVEADPKLILWPETALPAFMNQFPNWPDSLRAVAGIEQVPILFGTLDVTWRGPEDYDYFNAAMLTDQRGELGGQPAYHKGFLVPIVERVPFVNPDWFSGIDYFGGFGQGLDPRPFQLPFGEVGVLICYESIYPQLSRRYRRDGASLLVNITNDAWFGRSAAPHQHIAHLALRAIETRVGIVRSANTGISGYFDPLGRLHEPTELFVPAARTYQAQTTNVRTLYVSLGDWLGLACLAGTLALTGLYVRKRPVPAPPPGDVATT